MPGNFADSFEELPQTSGQMTPQQIELAAARETSNNDAVKATLAQIDSENSVAGQLRSAGAYVSDLGTKAVEGIQGMTSRFGDNIPFLSAGAKTPSFTSLIGTAQSAVTGVISGAIASAFGKSGMIPASLTGKISSLTDPKATASAVKSIVGNTATEDRSHLVTLTSLIDGRLVEFVVMPEVVENRTVGYEAVAPAQSPGAFQKYKGTESTQWTINATFVSRTSIEATTNLFYLNTLRGWTMPFFGENTRKEYPDKIGAPPPVLMLKGLRSQIIGPMPVVITSLSWNWPKDVDYIPAAASDGSTTNIPFPVVLQVAIQCVESLSTVEFNQFDLNDFFQGKMIEAFRKSVLSAADFNENYGSEGRGREQAQVIDPNYGHEGRNSLPPPDYGHEERHSIAERVYVKPSPFKSGGGGDFGGGGASGSF